MSVGKEYQRRTRMLILRAAMLKQQIHVKVNCKWGKYLSDYICPDMLSSHINCIKCTAYFYKLFDCSPESSTRQHTRR